MASYFSEISPTGDTSQEFLEIAVTEGTDTTKFSIVHYMGNGEVYLTYSLGAAVSNNNGFDVYTIDDSDPDYPTIIDNGSGDNSAMGNIYPDDAFALVDDNGNVVQFVSIYGNTITATEGPANGMSSTNIGSAGFGQSLQSNDGGSTYFVQSSPNKNTIPCFAADTYILTEDGARIASELRIGDQIMTADHGLQPILWLQQFRQDLSAVKSSQKPVRIEVGAFGHNCPDRDLTLTPQHRVVIDSSTQLTLSGSGAMLAPSKALTALPRVSHVAEMQVMDWVHFAFARHEVVIANGCEVESLLLSDLVLSGMTKLQRDGMQNFASVHQMQIGRRRRLLTVAQARRLVGGAEKAAA